MNILINDMYLDFTYSKEVSIERRFFVEIENDEKTQEVFIFMSELNTSFEKHKLLKNIVLLSNKDLLEDYLEKDKEKDSFQSNKEMLVFDEKYMYTLLGKTILAKIDSMEEKQWLDYCIKRYAVNKVEFTEKLQEKEIKKFHESNKTIRELWNQFPVSFENFDLGGDMKEALTIPDKFSQFLKKIQYYHLNNKFSEQGKQDKKNKI